MIWRKPRAKETEAAPPAARDHDGVELMWCGSLRCYARRTKGEAGNFDVAVCQAVHVYRLEEGVPAGTPRDAMGVTLTHLMMTPTRAFNLLGIEWLPRSRGGTGAVLRDEPPAQFDGNPAELVRADLARLAEKGWPVT